MVAFLHRNSYCANISLSKQSKLFLREELCVYGTAAAVKEINLVTDLAAVCGKAQQLSDGLLALPFLLHAILTR